MDKKEKNTLEQPKVTYTAPPVASNNSAKVTPPAPKAPVPNETLEPAVITSERPQMKNTYKAPPVQSTTVHDPIGEAVRARPTFKKMPDVVKHKSTFKAPPVTAGSTASTTAEAGEQKEKDAARQSIMDANDGIVRAAENGAKLKLDNLHNVAEESRKTLKDLEEENARKAKRAKSIQLINSIADGIGAISNLYFATKGAPSVEQTSYFGEYQDAYEKARKDRDMQIERHRERIDKLNSDIVDAVIRGDMTIAEAKRRKAQDLYNYDESRRREAREEQRYQDAKARDEQRYQDNQTRYEQDRADRNRFHDENRADQNLRYNAIQKEKKEEEEKRRKAKEREVKFGRETVMRSGGQAYQMGDAQATDVMDNLMSDYLRSIEPKPQKEGGKIDKETQKEYEQKKIDIEYEFQNAKTREEKSELFRKYGGNPYTQQRMRDAANAYAGKTEENPDGKTDTNTNAKTTGDDKNNPTDNWKNKNKSRYVTGETDGITGANPPEDPKARVQRRMGGLGTKK